MERKLALINKRCGIFFCALLLLAACGGSSEHIVTPESSVSVVQYCKNFAKEYLDRNEIEYNGLAVEVEKKPGLLRMFSNVFSPSHSRFTAGYDCRFTAHHGEGEAQEISVGLFLTGTSEFAHYTKWENLQIIPIGHVVDEAHGRAGYGVFKYLKEP